MRDGFLRDIAISTATTLILATSTLTRRRLRLIDMLVRRPRRELINKRNT
jgi:hypothetical protein